MQRDEEEEEEEEAIDDEETSQHASEDLSDGEWAEEEEEKEEESLTTLKERTPRSIVRCDLFRSILNKRWGPGRPSRPRRIFYKNVSTSTSVCEMQAQGSV